VLYVPNKQAGGGAGTEGAGTSADDGEGPVVSTPAVTQQVEGNTELLDEKGGKFTVIMALTLEWGFPLFIIIIIIIISLLVQLLLCIFKTL
jgi:hypothetical protein